MDWFKPISCWNHNVFNVKELKRIAEGLEWKLGLEIVEREILFYDTMYTLFSYFPRILIAGGGSIINRVFIKDSVRFSFDIDATALEPLEGKAQLLMDILDLNVEIENLMNILQISGREIRIGEFTLDTEKNFFPNIISLKRIVPSVTFGTHLPTYLKSRYNIDTSSSSFSKWFMDLKDEVGFMPCIEEIRIEIGFSRKGFEGEYYEVDVDSLISRIEAPRLRLRCKVSTIEYSIVSKLLSLSRKYSNIILQDMVRDLCDLQMFKQPINKDRLRKLIEKNNVNLGEVKENIEILLRNGEEIFMSSWHFTLVRRKYSWSEICKSALKEIKTLYNT
ncbi:MAG: hypothetical protein QXY40_02355 [Candidatus Methanomethylicia archaeon]